jgi:hypothetical protein
MLSKCRFRSITLYQFIKKIKPFRTKAPVARNVDLGIFFKLKKINSCEDFWAAISGSAIRTVQGWLPKKVIQFIPTFYAIVPLCKWYASSKILSAIS